MFGFCSAYASKHSSTIPHITSPPTMSALLLYLLLFCTQRNLQFISFLILIVPFSPLRSMFFSLKILHVFLKETEKMQQLFSVTFRLFCFPTSLKNTKMRKKEVKEINFFPRWLRDNIFC